MQSAPTRLLAQSLAQGCGSVCLKDIKVSLDSTDGN